MTKNLKISLIILGILIGLYLIDQNSQSKYKSTSKLIFSHDKDQINKFLIQNGNEAIELTKIDTVWTISGNDTLVMKSQSIDNLFDKVLESNTISIQSEKPEKYNLYSVDDSSGIHLAVIDQEGETIEYFIFGRSKSDYQRCNIRIGDDPKVYLLDQNVTYMLQTRETYWGEKPQEIIPTDPEVQ